MQLNELRKELKFNGELMNLVETLKNIAASQYHLMEREKERFGRFMEAFAGFFRVVNLVEVANPLVKVMTDKVGIVIVTSDSGFMGGLNQGVIRDALKAQGDLPNDKVELVVIGEKGAGVLGAAGRRFKFFKGVRQETIYEQAQEIRDYLVKEVMEQRIGKVMITYPKPISFSAQTIVTENLLPCAELFDQNAVSEVSRRVGQMKLITEAGQVIVESSFSDMAEYLASVWVSSKLFELFEDSKLAEFSARAMHLEGSSQKVQKDYKRVKHLCFKASHEKIDKGMRESFAAKGKRRRKRPAEAA